MRFCPDNKLYWYQDHMTTCGESVPSDIDFRVKKVGDGFSLSGCGYGCLECHTDECYGNGALFVFRLTSEQRKLLDEAAEEYSTGGDFIL